ncbi:major facilitator superfamily domain-containing protein [Mycena belliarum]|uniref:Major facilitator superfamily domain-containing protein n=1 Tax=Mycena belliarum TaxID=1033014 RepID=A0AAD6XM82_9AGAR|nr:major facilitator superfamily domain-containing protein [Mycena belliae]
MAISLHDLSSQASPLDDVKHLKLSDDKTPSELTTDVISVHSSIRSYRLYKRRFVGIVILNIVSGMTWPWFGPIANDTANEFGITLDQVNWLGNVMALVYLPVSLSVPEIIRRYGIRRCCDIGAAALLVSAWIRYAGTVQSLSNRGAYALLFFGQASEVSNIPSFQFFAAIAQPIFQVIGPKYSETWFDLRGRTTATMIAAIANPVGGALGQLLSPIVGDTRQSILVLGIMSTVAAPFVFLISAAPPTPPTYSASKQTPGILSLLRVMCSKDRSTDPSMTPRERLDFAIVWFVFGVLSSALNVFAILTAQILQPMGYTSDTAGLMGAALLLSGIVGAIVSAPLFDRVFTTHLAITTKILVPILGGAWLSFIWAVKPNNEGGLYAICVLIGVASVTMLPVSLELACEVTRNADGSSALLWFACNLFAVIFILAEGALRAGPDANPPLNMRRALILSGTTVMISSVFVLFLQGKQTRKQIDADKLQQAQTRPTERLVEA